MLSLNTEVATRPAQTLQSLSVLNLFWRSRAAVAQPRSRRLRNEHSRNDPARRNPQFPVDPLHQ